VAVGVANIKEKCVRNAVTAGSGAGLDSQNLRSGEAEPENSGIDTRSVFRPNS
jgi:hypothetical protein